MSDQPPWQAPPRDELGVRVAERVLLGRNERVAIAVLDFTVHRTGLLFDVVAVSAGDALPDQHLLQHRGGDDDERLELSVGLADGNVVRDLDFVRLMRAGCADDAPAGASLWSRGGSSGARRSQARWWLWPLPPAGPIVFRVAWGAFGIAPRYGTLDASRLLDALPDVRELWRA